MQHTARAMRDSLFCVVPAGDTLTSRRLFDALAAGCVPLILRPSAWQLTQHLPFPHTIRWESIAVFMVASRLSGVEGLTAALLALWREASSSAGRATFERMRQLGSAAFAQSLAIERNSSGVANGILSELRARGARRFWRRVDGGLAHASPPSAQAQSGGADGHVQLLRKHRLLVCVDPRVAVDVRLVLQTTALLDGAGGGNATRPGPPAPAELASLVARPAWRTLAVASPGAAACAGLARAAFDAFVEVGPRCRHCSAHASPRPQQLAAAALTAALGASGLSPELAAWVVGIARSISSAQNSRDPRAESRVGPSDVDAPPSGPSGAILPVARTPTAFDVFRQGYITACDMAAAPGCTEALVFGGWPPCKRKGARTVTSESKSEGARASTSDRLQPRSRPTRAPCSTANRGAPGRALSVGEAPHAPRARPSSWPLWPWARRPVAADAQVQRGAPWAAKPVDADRLGLSELHGCVRLDLSRPAELDWTPPDPEPWDVIAGKVRRNASRLCAFRDACYSPAGQTLTVAAAGLRGVRHGERLVTGHRWRNDVRLVVRSRPQAALAPAAAVAGSKAAGAGSKAGVGLLFHHSWSSYFHIAEAAMGVFAAAHVLQLDLRTVSLYMTGSKGAEIIGRLLGRPVTRLSPKAHSGSVCHERLVVGYPAQVLHSARSPALESTPVALALRFRGYVRAALGVPRHRDPAGGVIVHRAAGRKLLNEAEVQRALAAMRPPIAAQPVDFAALSTAEQVRTMARTTLLLGIQGAGMANALFLPDTAAVLVLKPQHYVGNYFDGLLSTLRLDWACWRPPAGEPKWTVLHPTMCRPDNELACIRDQDTLMDVTQLPDMLRRASGSLSARACPAETVPREETPCFKACFPHGPPKKLLSLS